jgi:hypothetical protein
MITLFLCMTLSAAGSSPGKDTQAKSGEYEYHIGLQVPEAEPNQNEPISFKDLRKLLVDSLAKRGEKSQDIVELGSAFQDECVFQTKDNASGHICDPGQGNEDLTQARVARIIIRKLADPEEEKNSKNTQKPPPIYSIVEKIFRFGKDCQCIAIADIRLRDLKRPLEMTAEVFHKNLANEIFSSLFSYEFPQVEISVDSAFEFNGSDTSRFKSLARSVPGILAGQLSHSNSISVLDSAKPNLNSKARVLKLKGAITQIGNTLLLEAKCVSASNKTIDLYLSAVVNIDDKIQDPVFGLAQQAEALGNRIKIALERLYVNKNGPEVQLMILAAAPYPNAEEERAEAIEIANTIRKKIKVLLQAYDGSKFVLDPVQNEADEMRLMDHPEEIPMLAKENGATHLVLLKYERRGANFNLEAQLTSLETERPSSQFHIYYGTLNMLLGELDDVTEFVAEGVPAISPDGKKLDYSASRSFRSRMLRHSITAGGGIIAFPDSNRVFLDETSSSYFDLWYTHYWNWPLRWLRDSRLKIDPGIAMDFYLAWYPGGAGKLPDSLGGNNIYNWGVNAMWIPKLFFNLNSLSINIGYGIGALGVRRVIESDRDDHEGDVLFGGVFRVGLTSQISRHLFFSMDLGFFHSYSSEKSRNPDSPYAYFKTGTHGGINPTIGIGYYW